VTISEELVTPQYLKYAFSELCPFFSWCSFFQKFLPYPSIKTIHMNPWYQTQHLESNNKPQASYVSSSPTEVIVYKLQTIGLVIFSSIFPLTRWTFNFSFLFTGRKRVIFKSGIRFLMMWHSPSFVIIILNKFVVGNDCN